MRDHRQFSHLRTIRDLPRGKEGSVWHVKDDLNLLRLRRADKSWKSIGRRLQRSRSALEGRLKKLRNIASPLNWTREQDSNMLTLRGTGRSWAEVGRRLGMNAEHCQYRYVLEYERLELAPIHTLGWHTTVNHK